MIGKPKYEVGDSVKFNINGEEKVGTIYIVDKYGTFKDDSDVSYDIMSEYDGAKCLFKHISEKDVLE